MSEAADATREKPANTPGRGRPTGATRKGLETRVRIINDEIVVTGDHVNKSYLDGCGDAENKLLIEGEIWHRTGDADRHRPRCAAGDVLLHR